MPETTSPPVDPRCACHHAYYRHADFDGRPGCAARNALFELCGCTGYVHCPSPDLLRRMIETFRNYEEFWSLIGEIDDEAAAVELRYAS